jgi:integrase
MARRPYGTGSLTTRRDRHGRETWYGSWHVGGRRVRRALGVKRASGTRDGLTRSQAEAELRRRMGEQVLSVRQAERKTVEEVGAIYVEHLRTIKQRKRTTLADYRGHLSAHLVPYFGDRRMDRIEPEHVEAYMHNKLEALSPKTVINHLTFLHGLFAFSLRRRWVTTNPVAMIDRPPVARQHARRIQFLQSVEVEAWLRAVPQDTLGVVELPLYLCGDDRAASG